MRSTALVVCLAVSVAGDCQTAGRSAVSTSKKAVPSTKPQKPEYVLLPADIICVFNGLTLLGQDLGEPDEQFVHSSVKELECSSDARKVNVPLMSGEIGRSGTLTTKDFGDLRLRMVSLNPPGLQTYIRRDKIDAFRSFLHSAPSVSQSKSNETPASEPKDVNKMPDEVRERRLTRSENLERLPAEDRMRINRSLSDWAALPRERQALMKDAFRGLQSMPPDQRSAVLDSSRFQSEFSAREREILLDMLLVEPYEPPK